MARPPKSGLDYFPHDTDASGDEKLEVLQALYGNDGYAFYFKLLERIYHAEKAELNISDAETVQILCRKYLLISPERFHQILGTALKQGCFDREAYDRRKVLTSQGIKKRAGVVFEKRKEMQRRYESSRQKAVSAAETGLSAEFHFTRESTEKKRILSSNGLDHYLTTDEISQVTAAYSNNITAITPLIAREIAAACRNYTFKELMYAIHTAAEANVRTWNYVAGVLEKRCQSGHVRDLSGYKSYDPDKYIKGRYGHMVLR